MRTLALVGASFGVRQNQYVSGMSDSLGMSRFSSAEPKTTALPDEVKVGRAPVYPHKRPDRPDWAEVTKTVDRWGDDTYWLKRRGKVMGSTNLCKHDDSIHVAIMESRAEETHRGVGRALHQIAVETSFLNALGGRVTLASLDSATGFHYKCGFRTGSKHKDRRIQTALQRAKRRGEDRPVIDLGPGLTDMSLPAKAIGDWLKTIQQLPILDATKNWLRKRA